MPRLSGGLLLRLRLQAGREVGSALRVRSGGDDGALVLLQDGQPVADVGGVIFAGFEGEPEVSGQEGASHLGDKLFAGVAGIAEGLASEVTVVA